MLLKVPTNTNILQYCNHTTLEGLENKNATSQTHTVITCCPFFIWTASILLHLQSTHQTFSPHRSNSPALVSLFSYEHKHHHDMRKFGLLLIYSVSTLRVEMMHCIRADSRKRGRRQNVIITSHRFYADLGLQTDPMLPVTDH